MTIPNLTDLAAGLSAPERARLLYGRRDWRSGAWQDHCGDPNCEHCVGFIPDPEPRRLSAADQALRNHLKQGSDA